MDTLTPTFEFEPYTPAFARDWDTFVASSRNGTFLLERPYMDYHSDRFRDASLIALRRGKPVALLPACRLPGDILSSHAGLTYGGWVLPAAHLDGAALLTLFTDWTRWCRQAGYRAIDYKPVPYIYHSRPSQEDLYALWRLGFTPTAVNLSSAINLSGPWKFDMSKRQQLRKAQACAVTIAESRDWDTFWHILGTCLADRHGAVPVHSLDEIKALAASFPANIRLFLLSDTLDRRPAYASTIRGLQHTRSMPPPLPRHGSATTSRPSITTCSPRSSPPADISISAPPTSREAAYSTPGCWDRNTRWEPPG